MRIGEHIGGPSPPFASTTHSSSSSVHRGRSGRGGREGGSAIQGTVGVESAAPLRDNIMLRRNEGRGEGGSGSGDKKRDRHSNDDRHKDKERRLAQEE